MNSSKTSINHPSFTTIPKFYSNLPKTHNSIEQKLREEARALFLQKRSKELLNNVELKALWRHLETHSQLMKDDEQYITYDDYIKVGEIAGDKSRHFLTATAFGRLLTISSSPGRVNIMSLFNYVMRKVWLQQTRIGLSLYDYTGQGYLRESVRI